MADIVMSDTLPRSGIPIAAGLENVYISIAGLIGAGKTTLAKALGDVLGLPVHYEPVTDNVYLEDFYKDMKRYGFPRRSICSTSATVSSSRSFGRGAVVSRTGPSMRMPSSPRCCAMMGSWRSASTKRTCLSSTT